MSDYLLGLITIPAAVAAIAVSYAGAVLLGRALKEWWLAPVEFGPKDWDRRTVHASCVLAARRVWAMKLPGSRLLVFRSNVGGTDYKYGTYFGDTIALQARARNLLLDEFDPR